MKALIIILLTLGIFGGAAYYGWELFLRPAHELKMEQSQPPPPPPPDPTLPELKAAVALQEEGKIPEARAAYADFVARHPRSTVLDEARERLGQINGSYLFSGTASPENQVYIVKPGDVITKVANKYKTTPELIMKANNLTGSILRIGQKLVVTPLDFSLTISRAEKRVMLMQGGKFFKQYAILEMPHPKATPAPGKKPQPISGRVADRIAWKNNLRIIFTDKAFKEAEHWVVISPSGHSLYPLRAEGDPVEVNHKPSGGGYALAPESLRELTAVLRKNDPVTIE